MIEWDGGSQGAVILADDTFEQVEPFQPYVGGDPVVTYATATSPVTISPVHPIALVQ